MAELKPIIELIMEPMRIDFENALEKDILEACMRYDIKVDKERLLQALSDAHKFYYEGYRDGRRTVEHPIRTIALCCSCAHKEHTHRCGDCMKICDCYLGDNGWDESCYCRILDFGEECRYYIPVKEDNFDEENTDPVQEKL